MTLVSYYSSCAYWPTTCPLGRPAHGYPRGRPSVRMEACETSRLIQDMPYAGEHESLVFAPPHPILVIRHGDDVDGRGWLSRIRERAQEHGDDKWTVRADAGRHPQSRDRSVSCSVAIVREVPS